MIFNMGPILYKSKCKNTSVGSLLSSVGSLLSSVGSLLSSEQDVVTCPPEIASQPAPPLPLSPFFIPLMGWSIEGSGSRCAVPTPLSPHYGPLLGWSGGEGRSTATCRESQQFSTTGVRQTLFLPPICHPSELMQRVCAGEEMGTSYSGDVWWRGAVQLLLQKQTSHSSSNSSLFSCCHFT